MTFFLDFTQSWGGKIFYRGVIALSASFNKIDFSKMFMSDTFNLCCVNIFCNPYYFSNIATGRVLAFYPPYIYIPFSAHKPHSLTTFFESNFFKCSASLFRAFFTSLRLTFLKQKVRLQGYKHWFRQNDRTKATFYHLIYQIREGGKICLLWHTAF